MTQPVAGKPVPYDRFSCGLTFAEIVQELRREARQVMELEGRRMFWTRRTVLGRMREHKLAAYESYSRWIRGGAYA